MKCIAICNQKGGVGKTSTTINLGAGLVKKGYKVLLIDADPQYSMTVALGNPDPDENFEFTLANIFINVMNDEEEKNLDDKFFLHHEEGFDYIPSNSDLQGVEFTMNQAVAKETLMSQFIRQLKENKDYDYILIDCEPALQNMSINSLTASDGVIIPTCAQYLSVKGLQQLFRTIAMIKKKLNHHLVIEGVCITMYDNRTNFQKDICKKIDDAYGNSAIRILESKITNSIKVGESSALGISVIKHAPSCKVAQQYMKLTEEVLDNE